LKEQHRTTKPSLNSHCSRTTWVSQDWQTIQDLNAARGDGGGSVANQNSNKSKALFEPSPPEYQHKVILQTSPSPNQKCQSTESKNINIKHILWFFWFLTGKKVKTKNLTK